MGQSDNLMGMMGGFNMPGMAMNVFSEMPNERKLFKNQYEILAGRWAEAHDEVVLVLAGGNRITDFELYSMGLRDRDELNAIFDSFVTETEIEIEIDGTEKLFSFDTLMSVEFKVVNPADFFVYDEEFSVWVDRSNDDLFMQSLIENGLTLRIVGIVQPDSNSNVAMLSQGINYTPELVHHLINEARNTEIVKHQLANPDYNVITGRTFEDEQENPETEFDFSRIISVDEDLLADLFNFDFSDFEDMEFNSDDMDFDMSSFDFTDMDFDIYNFDFADFDMSSMDLSGIDFSNLDLSNLDFSDLFDMSDFDFDISMLPPFPNIDTDILLNTLMGAIPPEIWINVSLLAMNDLETYFVNNVFDPNLTDNNGELITQEIQFATFLMSDYAQQLLELFTTQHLMFEILSNENLQNVIQNTLENLFFANIEEYMSLIMVAFADEIQIAMEEAMIIVGTQIEEALQETMQQVMASIMTEIQNTMTSVIEQVITTIAEELEKTMTSVIEEISTQIATSIEDMFKELQEAMEDQFADFDEDTFAEAFQVNMGEEEIFDLMTAIMNPNVNSFERNLTLLGYADLNDPSQINIYPTNFESKQVVMDILDEYNQRMEDNGQPEKVVRFVDLVGIMMASVTDIIDLVSYGLIAFVSISLVVSSIMIGVITFVSVLERKKEIGILRAIGASKQNIKLVFNAETLIIGFIAGVFGVLITILIVFVANIILYNNLDIENLAQLPTEAAFVLVGISMFLTFIAGLMPASAAARKDPVEALRSE